MNFAIIENEFSEFGIDAEIIRGVENSNIFELSNGCICCTMNTELQETLEELLNSPLEFNHLIIETTGMAEPDSVVQSVVANVRLKETFYIDGVICLVDAINFDSNIKQVEAIKQIAMADIILINKTENISKETYGKITDQLKALNPFAM
ncbi:MAG: GTP-binding protein [Chloroflexia bacterium]|nr:GTP-binding protein [Chloroflexia bacterium]